MDRLELEADDREVISFLIGSHLEISAMLRRDIFDPRTFKPSRKKWGRRSG